MASDDRTGMVLTELSEDEWKKRSEKLASLELERDALEAKKASHNREWNEQIRQFNTDISQTAEEVSTHQAWIPAQTGMFEEATEEEAPPPPAGGRRRRGRAANANGVSDVA